MADGASPCPYRGCIASAVSRAVLPAYPRDGGSDETDQDVPIGGARRRRVPDSRPRSECRVHGRGQLLQPERGLLHPDPEEGGRFHRLQHPSVRQLLRPGHRLRQEGHARVSLDVTSQGWRSLLLEHPAAGELPERGTRRVQGALARLRRERHRTRAVLPPRLGSPLAEPERARRLRPIPGAIRGPGRGRRGHDVGKGEQDRVVGHSPAREVPPGLIPVGLEWHALLPERIEDRFPLFARDRDRSAGRRIGIEGHLEEPGDPAQAQVASPQAELCLHIPWVVHGREGERGTIQYGSRRGYPVVLRLGRPEEHERRQRAVGFFDVDEPALPLQPDGAQLAHALERPMSPNHLAGRGRRTRPHLEGGDADLPTRVGRVDRREVRDQQRQQEEPDRCLREGKDRCREIGGPGEAEREQRRAGQRECLAEREPVDAHVHERVAREHKHQPDGQRHGEADRSVGGQPAVPGFI